MIALDLPTQPRCPEYVKSSLFPFEVSRVRDDHMYGTLPQSQAFQLAAPTLFSKTRRAWPPLHKSPRDSHSRRQNRLLQCLENEKRFMLLATRLAREEPHITRSTGASFPPHDRDRQLSRNSLGTKKRHVVRTQRVKNQGIINQFLLSFHSFGCVRRTGATRKDAGCSSVKSGRHI